MPETTVKRTGWVTFASLVMFLAGALNLVWAIEEFSGAAWLKNLSAGDFGTQYTIWAIVDLVIALVAFGAGASIWQGGKFGFWVGMMAAIFSAVRAFSVYPVDSLCGRDHHRHRPADHLWVEFRCGLLWLLIEP